MIQQYEFSLPPFHRGIHLITEIVQQQLGELPEKGTLHLFIKHTSAAITINENYAAAVRTDFAKFFDRLVPENPAIYTHNDEGSDDMPAHLKTALTGTSVMIPITRHALNLGTWQGIYLCEFRNKANGRTLLATITS